jgi:hypothetical protein
MKNLKVLLILSGALLIAACNNKSEETSTRHLVSNSQESLSNTPVITEENISDSTISSSLYANSSAAVEKNSDPKRKFVRTAELKFRVKNVVNSTSQIEDVTVKEGGFVAFTNLSSNIDYIDTKKISADSILETTHYTVSNIMTLRVPNTKLDTTLRQVAKLIDFLDYRIIKAEDVALVIESNENAMKRAEKTETIFHSTQNQKAGKRGLSYEKVIEQQELAASAKFNNKSLYDQIHFSTIELNIYQRSTIQRELIANEHNISEWEPSFGSKILDSLSLGWTILEVIFLFLLKIWALIVIGVAFFIFWKKFSRQIRK